MIKYIDHTGKNKTLYECDMCKVELIVGTHKIHSEYEKEPFKKPMKKKRDLCDHCYNLIEKSIKSYINKKGGTKEI